MCRDGPEGLLTEDSHLWLEGTTRPPGSGTVLSESWSISHHVLIEC